MENRLSGSETRQEDQGGEHHSLAAREGLTWTVVAATLRAGRTVPIVEMETLSP